MKKSIVLFLFIMIGLSAFSQVRWGGPELVRPRINIDANFGIPGGARGSEYGYAWAATLGLDVPVSHSLYGTLSGGYMSFQQGGKVQNVEAKSYIPVKGGAKYYIMPFLYAQAEVGVGFGIQKGAGTVLIISPGTGVSLPVTEKSAVNLGFRYESWRRDGGNIRLPVFKLGYQF